jgi:hypothetical protein
MVNAAEGMREKKQQEMKKNTEKFCNFQSNSGTCPTAYSMDTVGFNLE